jgi:lipopolysaccharide/colanic/teichoic acid biosynthesis glycosyltransferase
LRQRTQLLGSLIFAVLLPALIRWPSTGAGFAVNGFSPGNPDIYSGLLGCAAASVVGLVTLRKLRNHPGVSSSGYVAYAFTIAYGALAILLLFTRVNYSRYQLAASFLLNTAWFLWIHRVLKLNTSMQLGILTNEGMAAPPSTPSVRWRYLKVPQLDTDSIDGVVADLRFNHAPEWGRFLARCALAGLPVYDVRKISEQLSGQVEIGHLSENTFVSTLHGLLYLKLKRAIDVAAAVVLAPAFAAVIAIAAVMIRLEDGGPALFRQVRVGHRGRPFTIYKLRTMRERPVDDHRYTLDDDPRITRVGGFLRKYRIDEFPQIWNILKGEMSWIGPRPETLELSEWYDRELPFYVYRHMVRPGITGWAQVNQGYVAAIDGAPTKLCYDFYYIKHLSPWLDLLITAKTVLTIVTGFGSR